MSVSIEWKDKNTTKFDSFVELTLLKKLFKLKQCKIHEFLAYSFQLCMSELKLT